MSPGIWVMWLHIDNIYCNQWKKPYWAPGDQNGMVFPYIFSLINLEKSAYKW